MKTRKISVQNTALQLYNELLEVYFLEYNDLSDAKRKRMDPKFDPAKLTLDAYDN